MASSGHSNAQRTDLQTKYTAATSNATTFKASGINSVAAAEAATKQELQLVTTREQGAPLS